MYKFQSRVSPDLLMLRVNGEQILRLIGKESSGPNARGILLAAEMPQAIAALEAAVQQEEAAHRQAQEPNLKDPAQDAATKVASELVSLRQRTAPFIALLQRCHNANVDLVWGV